MAKGFCIPKQLADTLKKAAISGEINIEEMYKMTSTQRRDLFKKYVDHDTAMQINAGFEGAMKSTQQTALQKWAQDVFSSKEKTTTKYKDVLDKINSLDDLGVLTPESEDAFLQDLVASKLGATVTSEEAAQIHKYADDMGKLANKTSEFGTPTIEYFQARKVIEDYLDSITPSSKVAVASSIIGRGNMLASFKSPLLNIESNTVQGLLQAAERRITNMQLNGGNSEYANKYMRFVNEVYNKTGYDLTRMISLEGRRKNLGEGVITAQGEGKTRAVGRFYQDVVFNKLMSAPDVAFASVHFSDSANLASSKVAQMKGLKGAEAQTEALRIFKDATKLEPQTPEGKIVRSQAIADAEYATYTNKSTYSDVALGIRKIFNLASGDLRVGDNLMPFVKTPANVIGAGLEASGIPVAVESVVRMGNVLKEIHSGKPVKESVLQGYSGFSRKMVRAGLGLTFAYALSSLFKPEDFIGEYPVSEKERQLLALNQAATNSVKIGGKWVSLDYFGPLATPIVGMLYAKKYGTTLPEKADYYVRGALRQSAKIPGFTEFNNFIQGLNESVDSKNNTLSERMNTVVNGVSDYIRGRTVPALSYDFAKASDDKERAVPANDPLAKWKNSFPVTRETLPVKKNVFGEDVNTEGWKTLLFGARVKDASKDPMVQELNRLNETGNLPSITDVSKTSTRAKQLKEQIGPDKFSDFLTEFGKEFKSELEYTMDDTDYIESDDPDKKGIIDSVKNDVFEDILYKYGYEEPEK